MNQSKESINQIFTTLSNTWPDAQCELIHFNSFQLLIAVVLSAQATDKSVNKALEPLFSSQPNFSAQDLIKIGETHFLKMIQSIGLAKTKAKNCLALAKILIEKYNGEVPKIRENLEELPGVGRKTANVVLNVLFKQPTMAVDTHVARVSNRIGLVETTDDRLKIEKKLLEIIPKKFLLKAHHVLIFHGRYHCTAKKPKCESCPINDLCFKNGIAIH
jgi:endonuclease-3